MKLTYRITAVALILLLLAGCAGSPDTPTQPKATEPADTAPPTQTLPTTEPTTAPTQPVNTLEALRGEMAGTAQTFAVAYIGDTYDEGPRDAAALLNTLAPGLTDAWPFLTQIPAENIVDMGWGEIFCIIPADPAASVRVNQAVVDDHGSRDYSRVIYESDTGEPFLLICNQGEEFPRAQVVITGQGTETYWCPYLDPHQCPVSLVNQANEPLFWDLTCYADIFARRYQDMAAWEGFAPPVKEDLVGTAWGFEGVALNDGRFTTYLLAFEEDTAYIRWNDGIDEADHELYAPWTLTQVNGLAVLTLDLGNFEGIHSYNLLHHKESGWLYTVVDFSTGEASAPREFPYRFLEARSLQMPDPTEMVGTWERIRWEVEGYEEADSSGAVTMVIEGGSADTLTVSYTDREHPEGDYHGKALNVRQGVIYSGCGNELWLAEVDHVGLWDTTYTVTLLKDGTMMLQNYFELDGAPTVSYEWFARVG